jgi:hypothetical protein
MASKKPLNSVNIDTAAETPQDRRLEALKLRLQCLRTRKEERNAAKKQEG